MGHGLHIGVNRKSFGEVFARAARIAPASSPRPILSHVKMIVDDGAVTLMATDLELGGRFRVDGVTVLTPGSVVIPAGKMAEILSKSRDAELDIGVDGDHLVVRGQQSKFRLPTEVSSNFPEVPDFTADAYHVVASADLRKLIRRTITSTDIVSTRYSLGGCLVELSGDSVVMVATDGRRLARMTAPAESVNGATPPDGSPVIPVKSLKAIDGMLDDPELHAHVAFVDNAAVLIRTSDGASVIYSRLLAGRFPAYRDVFPTEVAVKIPLDVAEFRQSVTQASLVTSEESRGIDLAFGAGKLVLEGQAADVGSSQVTMALDHDGADITITFDARYVIEPLKTIDDDRSLWISLIDHKHAAVMETDDGCSIVIMPLTRDR